MTSSQQARESLGNLSDLFTGMLGTAVISGATPDTTPENKLAKEIKNIISAESATARTSDMETAKLAAEKSITDYQMGWTTPEKLEQSVIDTLSKTLRFDARARAVDGLPAWDLDRMYTIETLEVMPIQKKHVTDLMKEIQEYVQIEVAANIDLIMNNLDADESLFNGPCEVNTETSVRKSIESTATETMALAATTTAAANTAKMKEAASKVQHALMVRRNTELHNLDQLCQAATDRITELTAFQRTARNVRNQLDHSSTEFADVSEESKYDPIIERERAELILQKNKRNTMAVEMLGISARIVRQKIDNKIFKSDDLKKIAELKIWTTDTANMDTTKQLRHLLANWATVNIEEMWSIAPFIARLCETGVAGWEIPLIASLTDEKDNIAGSDNTKTAYQLLEPHWESLGFACNEPTNEEVTAYKGEITGDANIKEHLKIKKTYEMIRIYIDQSQKAYAELYLFLQDDIKTMCLEEGCYLGDPSEERVNQSTEMDFLTFFEAWFLQCETFGEFARQSARNTLLFATGCFVTDNYKKGCHRVLQAIKEADELDVTATWYETVYTVMSVLKSTRKVIWGLLCPKYQKITGDKDRNFLKDFQQFTIDFMKYMDTGNPVDTKLKMDGQSGRLVAAFTRQTDASYHDIDTRNKKAGVSNPNQGGGSSWHSGGSSGSTNKIDTSQADPSKDETSTKWSKGNDILHWATTENRLKYYAHVRGGNRCCDIRGCGTPLTDKRIKAWRKFQIKSDRLNAKGEYHDPTRPWGAYRWAVCEQCLQDAFDNKNNDGGELIYRDGHTVKVAGKNSGLRAAATQIAEEAAKSYDTSAAAKTAKKARKKRNKKTQQKEKPDSDSDSNKAESESEDEESKLRAIIKAQQMTIDCQEELLTREQSDIDDDRPRTQSSSRSSSRSSTSSRASRTSMRSRRGRGNFTDGAEAIAEHARNVAATDTSD